MDLSGVDYNPIVKKVYKYHGGIWYNDYS
jgi:hypothetical protein